IIYPATGKDRARVDMGDIEKLDDGEFLNDNLIVFYLRWLQDQIERNHPEMAKRIYFQNTFFYQKLAKSEKGTKSINYEAVKKWTSKVDLLSKDYIIIPINEHAHWYVAIICNAPKLLPGAEAMNSSQSQDADTTKKSRRKSGPPPRKHNPKEFRIITLDSLGGSHTVTCSNLKDYLVMEIKDKKNIDIERPGSIGTTAKGIPMQNNYYDCGLFLLSYVEMFLKSPDEFISGIL
ncbi:cysteine proteinase, partial [Stipitochalara longipes BDJ]